MSKKRFPCCSLTEQVTVNAAAVCGLSSQLDVLRGRLAEQLEAVGVLQIQSENVNRRASNGSVGRPGD